MGHLGHRARVRPERSSELGHLIPLPRAQQQVGGSVNPHRDGISLSLEAELVLHRVEGELATASVRQVAAGSGFTVAVTSEGKVYQMGETGTTGRYKWEGAKVPELVRHDPSSEACTINAVFAASAHKQMRGYHHVVRMRGIGRA